MTAITHPGLLHTAADFTRMQAQVAAGTAPWAAGWTTLTASSYAQLGATPRPLATVIRGGDGENFAQMYIDMLRTYQLALRWKVSGDTAYADLAVRFLNAWSSTMTTLTGNADRFLAAGIYGYQWANAAEIMRSYSGWASTDVAAFQALLSNLFYPLSHDFLINHNGSAVTNYWANWDLCSIAGIFAIGVFCDNINYCNEALSYFTGGRENGAADHFVYVLHPGYLGQWQESGRDQGHATLGIALGGAFCEMAWNQGVDAYGYRNNRFLAGAEYVAKSNLTDTDGSNYTLPFATYINKQGSFTTVSDASRPAYRPCWESVYNHYVRRKGVDAPWVAAMAAANRPEANSTNGDQCGFGTLAFTQADYAGTLAPSGLTACLSNGAVLLSWWGCPGATSYTVKRSASASGAFTALASVNGLLTCTDTAASGVCYYTVTATTAKGETAASNVVRIAAGAEARVILALNGAATDSSGFARHGTLQGGATWGSGRNSDKALLLDGTDDYLSLPAGILADIGDFTISAWVYCSAAQTNGRIFDFGTSDIAYMTLIAKDGKGVMRFSITGTCNYGEQTIAATSALPTGSWTHVAITLAGTTGTLYVNGVAVGSNTAISFAPFQMGNTAQNWLGRSQYAADAFFNGRLQDFRLYSGALTASAIAALAAA